ncbi:MAG: hypothetical protein PHN33_06030 [Candidatus Peribacteraceae bacterium]|nr:hypothetical protein [Candidatus Peribacteraceae bacterium]
MPTPSNRPSEIPYDRGPMRKVNESLLTSQLRHAIRDGEIKHSDFADWPSKPWMVINFLEGRVLAADESTKPNAEAQKKGVDAQHLKNFGTNFAAVLVDAFGQDVLDDLRAWAEAAKGGDRSREQWEQANPEKKQKTGNAVRSIYAALSPNVEVLENTERNLHATKGLNMVEDVLRGTKEYVWDEFWDHPEMSAGLVVVGYLCYNMIKGKKLWTLIKWGAGITVAGAFLKDKFGVQPVEKAAEIAERVGLQSVADGIRGIRDTAKRGLFGPEGKGTLNGYYEEKLKFNRDNEKYAFRFLLEQNPTQFLDWYDAARKWQVERRGGEPTGAAVRLVDKMMSSDNLPTHFQRADSSKMTELLLGVTDRVLLHIAQRNGKATVDDGLALLKQKYINGEYFNQMWERFDAFSDDLKKKYHEKTVRDQIDGIRNDAQKFYQGLALRVQKGSGSIDFMDVLMLEADMEALRTYEGPGLTYGNIESAANVFWATTKEKLTALGEGGKKAWTEIESFFVKTVPLYWNEAWATQIKPFLSRRADDLGEIKTWFDTDVQPLIDQAKARGGQVILDIRNSRIAQVLKQIGIGAADAVQMTIDEAEELGKWLEESSDMHNSLRTFQVSTNAAGDLQWSLGDVADPRTILVGYEYHLRIQLIPELDPAFAGLRGQPPPRAIAMPSRVFRFAAGAPAFVNQSLLPVGRRPVLPGGYRFRRAEIELEVSNPTGTYKQIQKKEASL